MRKTTAVSGKTCPDRLSIAEAIHAILREPTHAICSDTGTAKSPLLYQTKEPLGYGILHFDRFIVDRDRIELENDGRDSSVRASRPEGASRT
jgi:hypothetical protein